MIAADQTEALQSKVLQALQSDTALNIVGGNTKAFYGNPTVGETLDVSGHQGVVNYEPTELVLTARAGTPIAQLEALVAAEGQALAFEPPQFGPGATLGGTIAAGLSGPARPYQGSARDMVLGMRLLNGRGEIMRFGGEVMKNVAGYDVSRLNVGALGTLGVILEVSLKVLPAPRQTATLRFEAHPQDVHRLSEEWLRNGRPLTATLHDGDGLYARFSGTDSAVADACDTLDAERLAEDDAQLLWQSVRDHTHHFFNLHDTPLWRLSLPPATDLESLMGQSPALIEWSGQQLWLRGEQNASALRNAVACLGGSATLFRADRSAIPRFQPLDSVQQRIHQALKKAFDPQAILNPGRLYPWLEEH